MQGVGRDKSDYKLQRESTKCENKTVLDRKKENMERTRDKPEFREQRLA